MLSALLRALGAFFASVFRTLHVLWLQIAGFFFMVFAVIAGMAAAREFQAHMAGRAALACLVTAMFTWFGLTSFWRASRRSREASR